LIDIWDYSPPSKNTHFSYFGIDLCGKENVYSQIYVKIQQEILIYPHN